MQHGDIVLVGKRKAVALRVSPLDIKKGTDVMIPGVYPFAGYWYGKNPLDHKSYGKILSNMPLRGTPIGKVISHSQIKFMGI